MDKKKSSAIAIIAYIVISISAFALILILPITRELFKQLSGSYPYIMGFVKFSVLATAGELIAAGLANKELSVPPKIVARFIIWGLIGIWITFMMKVYSSAVGTGMIPGSNILFLRAFYTSVIMNCTFGPTFMAIHKCSDKWLEMRSKGMRKIGPSAVVSAIDWSKFVTFTLFKTVPLFWIPAHTVTFMLPSEYQVIMAASLSVALGIILNIKR